MSTTPRRRWFQFGLGPFMLWVVPYFAFLAWIVGWRDETPPSDDEFGDALGAAIFRSIKQYLAILITFAWATLFCVVTGTRWWLRRRDARVAGKCTTSNGCIGVKSRRLPLANLPVPLALLGIGTAFLVSAAVLASQSPSSDSQEWMAVFAAVFGLFSIGAGIGQFLDGLMLGVILGVLLPLSTCLCVFAAFWFHLFVDMLH